MLSLGGPGLVWGNGLFWDFQVGSFGVLGVCEGLGMWLEMSFRSVPMLRVSVEWVRSRGMDVLDFLKVFWGGLVWVIEESSV